MPITLSKPAGLPVFPPHARADGRRPATEGGSQPGSGQRAATPGSDQRELDCLLARLLADEPWRADVPWPEGFAGGIAHRLDTSTSGAVLVAEDPDDLVLLRTWFSDKALSKTYRLLVARDVPWNENACAARLAHDKRHKGRMIVERGASTPHRGRWYDAETRFRRVRGRLFEAVIRTGVMHQIRAHAAFVGIPLVGDRTYGGGPTPDDAPSGVTFFLHHIGVVGPGGFRSDPVPTPAWAEDGRALERD